MDRTDVFLPEGARVIDGWHDLFDKYTGVVLVAVAGLPVAALAVWALARRRGGGAAARRTALADVGMVYGTVPWVWMAMMPGDHAGIVPTRVSLVPLRDLVLMPVGQVAGNLLMFAALGFFAPRRFAALATVTRIVALAAGCSVLIEITQYVLWLDRVSSVDDVLLNATGAGLAALASRHRRGGVRSIKLVWWIGSACRRVDVVAASGEPVEPPEFLRLAAHPLRWRLLTLLAGGDLRVRELVSLADQPQNLVSYHLRLLRESGLVTTTRSSADRRDSYYRLAVDACGNGLAGTATALHPALREEVAPLPPAGRVAVLFVCTGNRVRSPIAEALLRHHTAGRVRVASAGTLPAARPHPDTARVLRDAFGITTTGHRPRDVTAVARRRFDHVITVCDRAREACPEFGHGPNRVHWSIADPHGDGDTNGDTNGDGAGYRRLREVAADLDTRVRHLLPVLATAPSRPEGLTP